MTTLTRNQSDTYITGKLYPRLDAYYINTWGKLEYLTSSCEYETEKRFRSWLANNIDMPNSRYITIKTRSFRE